MTPPYIILLKLLCAILLALGSWLIFRFVLEWDAEEWDQMSEDWLRRQR